MKLNIYRENKSQIAVFEMIFAVILLISSIVYFGIYIPDQSNGLHKIQVESFMNSIYYNEEFRSNFIMENLSQSIVTENFNNLTYLLNKSFSNYGFKISNESISKTIFSCNETLGKEINQKLIAIKNNDIYEFRILTLEVCY